jgi:phage anti-repressor protein
MARGGRDSHVKSEISEWLGYEHKHGWGMTAMFIKLLQSHKLSFRELKHTDSDFTSFPELVKEASLLNKQSLYKQRWLIVALDNFKHAMMFIRTKRGEQVRNYYLSLEKMFHSYTDYSRKFMERTIMEKDDTIEKQDATINIKFEVVVPLIISSKLIQYFLLIRMLKDYVPSPNDLKYYSWSKYVCIKAQHRAICKAMRLIKRLGDGTNREAIIVVSIRQPQHGQLCNQTEEDYGDSLTCYRNGITTTMDDLSMITIICKVNDEKYPYEVKSKVGFS